MSSMSNKIKQTYNLAAMSKEAKLKMTASEWKSYRATDESFDAKVGFEKRQYELEYKNRVNAVRRQLINKAGSKEKNFVHRLMGSDKFDRSAIDRKAHLAVRNAHLADIEAIEVERFDALKAIASKAEFAKQKREKPRRDFQRAADRRTTPDRRSPSR